MKIALVCQRYGETVNGGAEQYCRQLAEKLCACCEVEVLTTCAEDYITWKNAFRPGVETLNGVTLRRFAVDKPRNMKRFGRLRGRLLTGPHTARDEERWLCAQGPLCTAFVEYLRAHQYDYALVIFVTYLYYLTVKGVSIASNSVLLPTAHDEPYLRLQMYRKVFEAPRGMIYLTREEKALVERRFPLTRGKPDVIAGAGVEVPNELPDARERFGLHGPYILYVGRIDESKGCPQLFACFERYKKACGGPLKLVLAGKAAMDIPEQPDICSLGFVSDAEKFALMRESLCLVLPSPFESLSMVVLESFAMGRPVLVNGRCAVLKGHCRESLGGLWFENYPEFEGTLQYLETHPRICAQMGENGRRYVEEKYRWDAIIKRVKALLDTCAQDGGEP